MNSTGKELSQADLIRNYILMGLEPAMQTRLYEDYWRPMELDFGQEAYGNQFDSFMRHYLTVRTGEIPREREVYEAFKDHARTKPVQEAGIETLVKEIRSFASFYCAMAIPGRETNAALSAAFHDLRELKVEVAYPFLLELYYDYAGGRLSSADFSSAVRFVEAYVFRRAICSIPTNSMNKTFGTLGKALKKDRYLESIQGQFLTLPSYRRFPSDEEFRRDLRTRDLYNFPRRSYWLRRFENHDRKERVAVDEYTIEHILPQNPKLSAAWRQMLGSEWQRVQEQWLHTLGNLTLTGYNAEYSDRPFIEKRDMHGGFKQSPLKLNAGLGAVSCWDESAIENRATRLADLAVAVWPAPKLDAATLATYQPAKVAQASEYSIDNHPHLRSDSMRRLFEAFRKEVLALDPCVSEEFLKKYVAYKAETNFVDVYPQAKRLKLVIGMKFADVNDPNRLCKDITGRRLNGDAEIELNSLGELSYIMRLVRQSFERQMIEGNHL